MKKILKLLIDKKNRAKILAISDSITQTFKAFYESPWKLKEKWSSIKNEEKDYIYYLDNNHNSDLC